MSEIGEEEVYRLEDGEKVYDEFFHAVQVAEAKAEDEDRSVTVYRKLLNSFEPLVKIHPDGSQEKLD